jgi:hypothetical protein
MGAFTVRTKEIAQMQEQTKKKKIDAEPTRDRCGRVALAQKRRPSWPK